MRNVAEGSYWSPFFTDPRGAELDSSGLCDAVAQQSERQAWAWSSCFEDPGSFAAFQMQVQQQMLLGLLADVLHTIMTLSAELGAWNGQQHAGFSGAGWDAERSLGPDAWSPRSAVDASDERRVDDGDSLGPASHKRLPAGLRPNASRGAQEARDLGFDGTIGGIGQRNRPSDHPHGNAIDVMTQQNRGQGRQIAEHFRANHERLGVKYVIFEQQICSPKNNWQWRPMKDRGSPTQNHMDHVHISFH